MSSVLHQTITAQDFWQLPDTGVHRELVRGEVIETMPPGGQHGAIAVVLAMLLRLWAKRTVGGYVGVEAGYTLAHDPDTVRGPDVSYVRAERIPSSGVPEGFWELAPDLAVEVVSPSETADEIREKVRDFLYAGTPLVWTIYPRTREVIVHTPDGVARTYGFDDTLSFSDVLPEFTCSVRELFE
ncbi:MAG TPA: Uma2 family endonuclease [Roseiflexaceae bacterium]|nr:Uma2 family endonuclease [Roseiflexaceae bacterium]